MADWEVVDNDSLNDEMEMGEPDEPSLGDALVAVEHFVFWAALAVRKMIEARKMSDEFEALEVPVVRSPRKAGVVIQDHLNSHHFERHYDLDRQTRETIKPVALCHRLIHSFVFVPVTDEPQRRMEGLLFNSDRTKHHLWFIEWNDFVDVITEAIEDDIAWMDHNRETGVLVKSRHRQHK
jgi:hypothetical protein